MISLSQNFVNTLIDGTKSIFYTISPLVFLIIGVELAVIIISVLFIKR